MSARGHTETEPPGLSQDLDDYDGRWVAVRDGTVVAHGESREAVLADPSCAEGDLVYPIGEPPSGFYLINV